MATRSIEDVLAERFRIERPPTLTARSSSRARIGFSRMRSGQPMRGRSMAVPREHSFSFHVPLTVPFFTDLWTGGRRRVLPVASLADAFLFDLRDNPVVGLDTPFDSMRFYVPRKALDEMASESEIRRIGGLHTREFGRRDPVLFGLAQALAGAMDRPREVPAMFTEHIAHAFFLHIIHSYGTAAGDEFIGRGLTAWQIRRAREFIESHLSRDPTILELARECGCLPAIFHGL
jgi:AraC family transcriptional regulator